MHSNDPKIQAELRRTKEELDHLKAEKLKLFAPNPHPFAEPDRYPRDFTPAQVERRNQLIAQIEQLEQRIKELQEQV
jgi:hypothetical protein